MHFKGETEQLNVMILKADFKGKQCSSLEDWRNTIFFVLI